MLSALRELKHVPDTNTNMTDQTINGVSCMDITMVFHICWESDSFAITITEETWHQVRDEWHFVTSRQLSWHYSVAAEYISGKKPGELVTDVLFLMCRGRLVAASNIWCINSSRCRVYNKWCIWRMQIVMSNTWCTDHRKFHHLKANKKLQGCVKCKCIDGCVKQHGI